MSGGAFEYSQYKIWEIAEAIRIRIAQYRKGHRNHDLSEAFLQEMIDFYRKAQEFAVLTHRMDWVLSGDDGEDDYFEKLAKDMRSEIKSDNPDEDEEWIKKSEFYR
jgi:hypothetical protein